MLVRYSEASQAGEEQRNIMVIDAKQVAQLRAMTGAGMMDAKKALEETGGDLEKATDELRKKGIAKAEKKADRATKEGLVYAYVHATGKLGAMVEILCETDFVARNEAFQSFCHDVTLHVSALDPQYLTREEIPAMEVAKQKEIFVEQMRHEGKPEEVIEKIVEGKLNKWYSEVVLLEQLFIKDEEKTIESLLKEQIAILGENMQIRRFVRFSI
ncbi:MAG: Elongation factor Ts [Candidatus Uhrbacteria bacterium GW2011_GWE2_40_58]|nr:MAG: Elongation factor Ts [Candidatus Uhrbacteria bacterium GW2011_GWF2_40_263]KKR68016.1 MAG: Elongation factor Ts [Candidatus Uhrbacteria bacterium GW2011_GWE2_40_58]